MEILDETSQVLEYSRRLEENSQALEAATAELRRANERLRHLDQLKDDFIATVSHELRTPLTAIRSFSEILLDTPDLDSDQRQGFLLIVTRESERLTRLIDDLLDVAKIESGRMEWQIVDCDLKEVVLQAQDATRSLLAERRIALEADLGSGAAQVRCDRDRLVQVVINLLSNAAKFVPEEGGRVRLRLDRAGRRGPAEGRGQRPRRADGLQPDRVREVPPARRRPEVAPQGDGPRPRHLPPDRRALRGPDLGREGRPRRGRLLLHPPGHGGCGPVGRRRPGRARPAVSPAG